MNSRLARFRKLLPVHAPPSRRRLFRLGVCQQLALAILSVLFFSSPSRAYGPLNHLCVVEQHWNELWPLIQKSGPISDYEARQAVLAGAMADDLGYYFTGNADLTILTNAMHYARTGEWVALQLHDAATQKNALLFAFALGELSHYAADRKGHFYGTNVMAVQLANNEGIYGWRQSYEQGTDVHTQVEAGFDFLSVTSQCNPETVAQIAADVRENKLNLELITSFLSKEFSILFSPASLTISPAVFADALLTSYYLFLSTADESVKLYGFGPKEPGIVHDAWNSIRERLKNHNREPQPLTEHWLAAGRGFVSVLSVPGTSALAGSFTVVNDFYTALLKHVGRALDSNFKPDLQFPNFNLDTDMPSVSGLYELADKTVEQIIAQAQHVQRIACPPKSPLFPDYFQRGAALRQMLARPVGKVSSASELQAALQPVGDALKRGHGTTRPDTIPLPDSSVSFTICAPGATCLPHSQQLFANISDLRVAAGAVSYDAQTTVSDLWLAALAATLLQGKANLDDGKRWINTILGEYRLNALSTSNASGFYPSEFCQ